MAYTTIDDPSSHFQTTLYTGSGTPTNITNGGNSDLQPDMVWIKLRNSNNGAPHISDSTRGVSTNTGKYLRTDDSGAESDDANGIRAFNTDGFKTGDGWFNGASGSPYVAWQWKAGGGTTASNTDGTITSTVQANQDAGFSIVTYTGTGSAGTIGHGLGVAPKVVIVKARSGVATSWAVFHKDGSTSDDDTLVLQTTAAKATYAGFWNNQYPSSSVFGISNDIWLNGNTENFVAYCFAEKQGYNKFGTYRGAGSSSPFVYTGFKPAFLLIRRIDAANSWGIVDNKRGYNGGTETLFADLLNAESSTYTLDLLSNGFRPASNHSIFNQSSGSYIYMAFAESPFVTSTGIPTTAR
jgi:hypothetical protein